LSLVLFLAAPICAQEARPRLYRVDDNVFRGLQPTRQDIATLASSGIRTVLDLRGALDHKGWERQAVEAAGMRYIRVGMSGFFAPSDRQIDKILAVLDDPTLGPIFVHCRRGADRSGVVIACYRITHDHWTNGQAMAEARQQGFSHFEVLMERYIHHFRATSASAGR
jgi:protein-tyrosine phosphatase